MSTPPVVVVGIDGRPTGEAALDWILVDSPLEIGTLRLVHAWSVPKDIVADAIERDRRPASAKAAAILRQAARRAATAGWPVDARLVEGWAGTALVEAAQGADLLVVGHRGFGPLRSVLFRSVSDYLTHHSPCPLVIVPHPTPRPRGRRRGTLRRTARRDADAATRIGALDTRPAYRLSGR